jgi:hypothetical protein
MLESGKELFNKSDDAIVDLKDLYSGNWVGKQRAALRRRLGKESGNADDATATQFISLRGMIKSSDVFLKSTESSLASPLLIPSALNATDSNETWFVRMMRYLLAGLVHSQWEYRHGHCLGLIAIFQGLNLLTANSSSSGSRSHLPIFLLEDIITTTLTVLVLDRYLDVEGSPENYRTYFLNSEVDEEFPNDFISPVKETAARLLSIVCSTVGFLDQQFANLCISKVLSFCFLNASSSTARDLSHWSVIQSGYITMKHLLRIPECLGLVVESGHGGSLLQSIRQGLLESNEEIRYEALSCLLSLKNLTLTSTASIDFVSSNINTVLPCLPQIASTLSSDFLVITFPLLAEVLGLYFFSPQIQTLELFHSLLENCCCAMLAQSSILLKASTGDHLLSVEKSCRKVLSKLVDFVQHFLDSRDIAFDHTSALLSSPPRLPLLRTTTQLLCDILLMPLHFSDFSIIDLRSLVEATSLRSEISSTKPISPLHSPHSTSRLLSLRPLLTLLKQLIGPLGAGDQLQFTSQLILQLLDKISTQRIAPPQALPDPDTTISTRSSRKRKRVAKAPCCEPLDSYLPQVELHLPETKDSLFTVALQLTRIDTSYRLENGMVLAASIADLISHSSPTPVDKAALLDVLSSSMEHLSSSVVEASLGIESPQRSDNPLPIFVIVNETGSLIDTPPLQNRQGVDLFNLQCAKLLWISWTALSLVHSLLLQRNSCGFSCDDLQSIARLFSHIVSALSSLESLTEFQPTLVPELQLCLRMFEILNQAFFLPSLCYDSLCRLGQSIPNSSCHSSYHARILSTLFCEYNHTLPELQRFLLSQYRSYSPPISFFALIASVILLRRLDTSASSVADRYRKTEVVPHPLSSPTGLSSTSLLRSLFPPSPSPLLSSSHCLPTGCHGIQQRLGVHSIPSPPSPSLPGNWCGRLRSFKQRTSNELQHPDGARSLDSLLSSLELCPGCSGGGRCRGEDRRFHLGQWCDNCDEEKTLWTSFPHPAAILFL